MLHLQKMVFKSAVNKICCPLDAKAYKAFKGHYKKCSAQVRKYSMCGSRFFFIELKAKLNPMCSALDKVREGIETAIQTVKGAFSKKKKKKKKKAPPASSKPITAAPKHPVERVCPKKV